MGHLIYDILNNSTAVYVFWGLCFLSFVLFVIYALSKEGRDEHGRAILGTACFYGAIVLFISMNIFMVAPAFGVANLGEIVLLAFLPTLVIQIIKVIGDVRRGKEN